MSKKLLYLISFVLVLSLVSSNVAFGQVVWEGRISSGSDDYEQYVSNGDMDSGSGDLEITEEGDPDSNQLIGLRFNGVLVPQGANISSAYVQFHVDETDVPSDNRPGTKFLKGEAVDNAAPFLDVTNNISSRPTTSAEASWDWPEWLTVHEEGPDQRTSDIAAVIKEIVDRPGWSPGNSLVLIITGSGENTAESFGDEPDAPPLLHVEFGEDPFLQDGGPDGIVSMEAENFHRNTAKGDHAWEFMTDVEGFTGTGFLQALPNSGAGPNLVEEYLANSPRLDYRVAFLTTGTHYVWVLGNMYGGSDDSVHVGFDAIETGGGDADRIQAGSVADTWEWSNERRESLGPAQIDVTTSGVHIVSVWMREDGWKFDKIVLTTNPDYVPTGDGPAESVRGLPVKSFGPIPVDGAIDVEEMTLEWSGPEGAVSHMVYLSTDETVDESDFLAETQMALHFADLATGTTYYWRVDEVQADGTVTEGDVWIFATLALEAHFPDPEDGAKEVKVDAQLQACWTWIQPTTGGSMSLLLLGRMPVRSGASQPSCRYPPPRLSVER